MYRLAVILAAHVMLVAATEAQPPAHATRASSRPAARAIAPVATSREQSLARQVAAYASGSDFSGQVLVVRGERTLLSQQVGLANREWSAPVTAATRFRIGSITKPVTAVAILRLAELGKLSIEDPLCRHLASCPAAWRDVTIAQLLSHTSGIPDFTRIEALRDQLSLDLDPTRLIATFRDLPLNFSPGTGWDYSNSGYVLLAHVIERVTGRPYGDVLRDEVFGPARMTATVRDLPGVIVPQRASGYGLPGRAVQNAPYVHMSTAYGAGDLLSTADDLLRFDRALFGGKLLGPASLRALTTPVRNGYGLGTMLGDVAGHPTVGHGGRVMGFTSFLLRVPDESLTVVVLSNFMDVNTEAMARELAAIALGNPVPPPAPLPPILVDPGPGTTGRVTFRLAGHPEARFVALAGSFNRWRDSHTGFVREGDAWVCRLDLPPGRYEYKFVVDGTWMIDPSNTETSGSGDFVNSVIVVR